MRNLPITWAALANAQADLLTRQQLNAMGHDRQFVRTQLRAGRWQEVTSTVIATTTGLLHRDQRMWAGVLQGGRHAAVANLTSLEVHGLRHWPREQITIAVPKSRGIEPLAGVHFMETRRPSARFVTTRAGLPVWKVEPSALLFAAYEPVTRTAYGLLSAVVQQRLTTPADLERWIGRMRPLRRAKPFRRLLAEMAGGVQSVAELDVGRMCRRHHIPMPARQVRRRDASGRVRYTDAEWRLPGGQVVVLEVDGAFHMEVEHWADDIERERALVAQGAIILRCTAMELREDDSTIAAHLKSVGVTASSA